MKLRQSLVLFVSHLSMTLGVFALLACFVIQSAGLASAAEMAFVRVVHASPSAGTVDVYVDGAKLLSGFTFGTITGYVSVSAGAHKIQVTPTGASVGSAVITQTVSVEGGIPYTVAAIGTSSTGFSLAAFADNNLLSGGMAKIRVYHLSPDAGPVDVSVGGNKVISALTYQNASGYLTVPSGSYTFKVTATQAGATVPVSATLNGGMIYSVFAVGLLKGSPSIAFKLAAVTGVPGMPSTGSDPNAPISSLLNIWLMSFVALLLIGSGGVARCFVVSRQK